MFEFESGSDELMLVRAESFVRVEDDKDSGELPTARVVAWK